MDVVCGEGRNSIFLAEKGFAVDAFDISAAGVDKAKRISSARGLAIDFCCCDLVKFVFEKDYDVILSHGVLHLCEKDGNVGLIQPFSYPIR